ncbi:unnamed protein product, partial [Nesidiocoris tenuis]
MLAVNIPRQQRGPKRKHGDYDEDDTANKTDISALMDVPCHLFRLWRMTLR